MINLKTLSTNLETPTILKKAIQANRALAQLNATAKLPKMLGITRKTASKYLNELESIGILQTIQIKNSKYFIHKELFARLQEGLK